MTVGPFLLLSLVLHGMEDAVARQCWQGATYSEAVVSPDLKSSGILRVPEASSLARCAGACCDLRGCDLAWLFERRCYVLSCRRAENCRPRQRPGADSHVAFLRRGPPQTLVLQSPVRGEPHPGRRAPPPKHRGTGEDPREDPAPLEGVRDFDSSDAEYAESYRSLEDEAEGRGQSSKAGQEAGQEASPGLFDWPAVQGDEGFNLSETEGGPERSLQEDLTESSLPQPGASPGIWNESRASASGPGPTGRSPAPAAGALRDEEHSQNLSSTSTEPTTGPLNFSADPSKPSRISPSSPTPYRPPPSSVTTQTTEPVRTLLVSVGDPVEVTLPQNTVELTASVIPEPETGTSYKYEWSWISSPTDHRGAMEGEHGQSVRISGLPAGPYAVKVSVRGDHAYGESIANVTVHSAARLNTPPKAVALPQTQDVPPPASTVIINGSQSTDDGRIVSYLWEQVAGPPWEAGASVDTPVLRLDLDPGEYTFRLTVTDSEGLADSTTASVRVASPRDDPPVARAGPDQAITLPLDRLTLSGNGSSDDHPLSSYLWSLHPSSQAKVVTMQDVRAPFLQLSGLQEGQYTFQLSVTDSSGQEDSSTVKVTVLPENRAPVAVVEGDRQLTLPANSITLDGRGSTDDQGITSFHWDTVSGPPGTKIKDADKAVSIATGLRSGSYKFRLTVQDQQGATDSTMLVVTVREAQILPLVAHASGSHTLTLPNNSLVLRGSVSSGGPANVSFLWVRDEQSPAAGDILYSSEHQASLYLANLVEGTYLFQLRVTDAQGRSSSATATVEVRLDPREREEVELELAVGVAQVSEQQRDTVLRQLAALLHVLDDDIAFKGLHGQSDISTVLRFSVQGPDGMVPGPKLARLLRSQLLREKTDFLLFKVLRVDTVMCLLLCSGRGQCDPVTKRCACDPLWMENSIRRILDDGESNCDWNVLYVILSSFVVIVLILSVSWAFVCCCRRGRRTKVRKKTKYTILDNMDEQERMELRPKYSIKHRSTEHNSSLMMSESEFDSEQDTILSHERPERARNRANGATKNGDTFSFRPVDG